MDFKCLTNTSLFNGISETEAETAVKCLEYYCKSYSKGEIIFHYGQTTEFLAFILSGSVSIEIDDAWGNKSILSYISQGEIFAETYSCIPNEKILVNAVALEKSEILFLKTSKLFSHCKNMCKFHQILISNLLMITSRKNLALSEKIRYTSSKSIRGRLISYLSDQSVKNDSKSFAIHFNRQQLADFLEVDRSAMSNELSKMQREGLLVFNKNNFRLIEKI